LPPRIDRFGASGNPETFDFLGFTHICATMRDGRFWVRRSGCAPSCEVKDQLTRRRHHPIAEQGRWLASVVRGLPRLLRRAGNRVAVASFRTQVTKLWHGTRERRSQAHTDQLNTDEPRRDPMAATARVV